MVDWTRASGREDGFYGVLVDPFNLDVEYERVDIGKVSLTSNYYTDERISGSMDAPRSFPNVNNRLLRIYFQTKIDDETETVELGTFFMRRKESTSSVGGKTRKIELHSTLWRHMNDLDYASLYFSPGQSPIGRLKTLVASGGGTIHVADNVVDVLFNEGAIMRPGTPRLNSFNYIADYLGCDSLGVNTHGVITCEPYILPEDRPVVWTFEDGVNCMYVDEVHADTNEDDIPTVIRVISSTNDIGIYAERYLPASSPYSFQQRGRHVVAYFEHNNLPMIVGHAVIAKECKLYADKDTAAAVLAEMSKYDDVTVVTPQIDGDGWVQTRWNTTTGWTQSTNMLSQATIEKKADEYYSKIISLAVSIEIEHKYAPIKDGDAVRFIFGDTDIIGIVHASDKETEPFVMTKTVIDVVGGALGHVYP